MLQGNDIERNNIIQGPAGGFKKMKASLVRNVPSVQDTKGVFPGGWTSLLIVDYPLTHPTPSAPEPVSQLFLLNSSSEAFTTTSSPHSCPGGAQRLAQGRPVGDTQKRCAD